MKNAKLYREIARALAEVRPRYPGPVTATTHTIYLILKEQWDKDMIAVLGTVTGVPGISTWDARTCFQGLCNE